MAMYIIITIEETYDKYGLEAAQAKYTYFFVTKKKTSGKHQETVDVCLKMDGYEECIVGA